MGIVSGSFDSNNRINTIRITTINNRQGERSRSSQQAQVDPSAPQEPPHAVVQPQFGFDDWDPRFRAGFSYNWDQNESNHKAYSSIHECMCKLQLQMGVAQDIPHQKKNKKKRQKD